MKAMKGGGAIETPKGPMKGGGAIETPKVPGVFDSIDKRREALLRGQGERDTPLSILLQVLQLLTPLVDPLTCHVTLILSILLQVLSRWISSLFSALLRGYINGRAREIMEENDQKSNRSNGDVNIERFRDFAHIFGGVMTESSYARAVRRWSPLNEMPMEELARRMVIIKSLLPLCDIAFLIEERPELYLGAPEQEVQATIEKALGLMRTHLPGADLSSLVDRDPGILFMPELQAGCESFSQLWSHQADVTPLDETALSLSSPKMLALAIRALSVTGLPAKV